MLRQQRELRNLGARIADGILLAFSLWLAHFIRFRLPDWGWDIPKIQSFEPFQPLLFLAIFLGPFVLDARGVYRQSPFLSPSAFLLRLGQAIFLVLVLMTLLIYMFQISHLARGVVVLFSVISFGLISARHFLFQNLYEIFFYGRPIPFPVLFVGDSSRSKDFEQLIAKQNEVKIEILGVVENLDRVEHEVSEWLHKAPISAVIFNVTQAAFEKIQKGINVCEIEGVEAWVITDYIHSSLSQPVFEQFQGKPVLIFSSREVPVWQIVAKRLLDMIVSFWALIFLSPIMGLIALAIRLESKGQAIFVQERSGQRGRVFRMYKFRTMVSNAAMLQSELQIFNQMEGPVFKIDRDPRITKFGSFLRRTSLDELPQLFNVLMGDMSLVGPRPLPVYETNRIQNWTHRRRLSVKPGLTCFWQIEGRNEIRSFEDWVRLDLEYVDHWSFWLDLKILFRTIPVVLTGFGAR